MTPTEKQFSDLCKSKGLIKKIVIKNFMIKFIEENNEQKNEEKKEISSQKVNI